MRGIRLSIILLFVFTSSIRVISQEKETINELVLWFQYSGKFALGEKYDGNVAFQYRSFTDREQGYHLFFSAGVTRKLDHGISVSAGIMNLNINQFVGTDFVLVPELRPYQSIQGTFPLNRSKFTWRIITEQRFFRNAENGELVDGYTHNWRFRNKLGYNQYLSEKLELLLSSEVMINAGSIDINIFDQHRAQVLFNHKLGKWRINWGYMHWFFQTPANRHENRHTLMTGVSHTF